MDIFAPKHLIMILLIVLLVFGTKKLRTIGADMGSAIKGFKDSMKSEQVNSHDTPVEVLNVNPNATNGINNHS